MKKTLDLRVLRVGEILFTGEAVSVSLRSGSGAVTILPDHTAFIASVLPCTVRVATADGGEHLVEADDGIVEMVRNTCTVLL